MTRVKYFQFARGAATEWSDRNPTLLSGEVGWELDQNGVPFRYKIGPGAWNDLPFRDTAIYPYSGEVETPVGDAKGNLEGLLAVEILNLMLNPYVAPVLSSPQNDAGGSFSGSHTFEIGQSITGPVAVSVNTTKENNLVGLEPFTVTAGGVFNNEGTFAQDNILLSLDTPLAPQVDTIVNIAIRAAHQQGNTNTVNTSIRFFPKIIWGVSTKEDLLSGDWLTLSGGGRLVTNDFTRDYSFPGNGYSWIAIPSMLNPTSPTFTDVTDPSAPTGYGMVPKGGVVIDNGVGTYQYTTFRSTFSLGNSTILRIS